MTNFRQSHHTAFQSESSLRPTGLAMGFARRSYSCAAKLANDSASKIGKEFTPNREAVLWKGLLSGLACGLAGTAAMTLFQLAWTSTKSRMQRTASSTRSPQCAGESQQDEPSTVKLAHLISKGLRHRPLKESDKELASYMVHFGFGTVMGGLYGISSEYLPIANLGHGLVHGIGLWAGADAIVLPALGFSIPVARRSAGEFARCESG